MRELFVRFATWTSAITGSPPAFLIAVAIIVLWVISGPLFGFSDTWQLVINPGTTIIIFLMVSLPEQPKPGIARHAAEGPRTDSRGRARTTYVIDSEEGTQQQPAVLQRFRAASEHAAAVGDAADAAAAGFTGRALRSRLRALGLVAREFQPRPPEPKTIDRHERRLAARDRERFWQRHRDAGNVAHAVSTGAKRRDLHLLLSAAAWAAIHAEGEQRQCSMSSLVADVLYAAGIIPEA